MFERCLFLELRDLCQTIGCDLDQLRLELTSKAPPAVASVQKNLHRTVSCSRPELSTQEAAAQRDLLCATTYQRLFLWLIARLNQTLQPADNVRTRSLGFIDLPGWHMDSSETTVSSGTGTAGSLAIPFLGTGGANCGSHGNAQT